MNTRRPLVHMASSIWMPEPASNVRSSSPGAAAYNRLTHPRTRTRPMPEQVILGHMNVIQYSIELIPSSICRPADGS